MAEQRSVDKDPMVEYVVKEFERYEKFHADRFEKDRKTYRQWKNEPPGRAYDWQNQVVVPLVVEAEQTITPRLFTALFPTDAPVDVHVEGDAPEDQGIRIKGIVQHHFRVSDVQGKALPMLTQTTLFGTGYTESGTWKLRKGWVYDTDTELRRYSVVESKPDCKFVNYFEMFPHPAKLEIGDGLPIIRRRFIDAEKLKSYIEDPRFKSQKLKEALDSEIIRTDEDKKNYTPGKKGEEYEVLEYWGPWDESYKEDTEVKTRKAVPYWIIVVNRRVLLRGIPNPYNHQIEPYTKVKLFESPMPDWFGVGIGSIGTSTQERVNKIVNQRLDNVDLILNKQGCYNGNDTLINTKKLQVSKPGQWHKVSDTVTSLRWMDTPEVTASSYKEEEIAKQDYREATGATAHLMPESGSEHRTAMGIHLLQGAAGMRFRPVLRKMEIDFIQKLAMFFFSNLNQFMTSSEWVMITGKQGEVKPIEITPEQLRAKVFFIPTGISETLNKEVQVGQLMRFKELTMDDPTVNRQEINRRLAELMGFKDVQRLLTPMQQGGPAGLDPAMKQKIDQRRAEGATPEQIKAELLGPPPVGGPQ